MLRDRPLFAVHDYLDHHKVPIHQKKSRSA